MLDPDEGLAADGTIVTGARIDRVPPAFAAIVDAARRRVEDLGAGSLYLYGSVATGQARSPTSDVDLLTVDIPVDAASAIGRELSTTFADGCREVAIAAARRDDYIGEEDEAYGNRVFLRHYCVHLTGPDQRSSLPSFAGDARAARGFNGDIARHAERWAFDMNSGVDTVLVGQRLARKTLLAVAGLVSVHDNRWTTDRATTAQRLSIITPTSAADLARLLRWADAQERPTMTAVRDAVDRVVPSIIESFANTIGLWP